MSSKSLTTGMVGENVAALQQALSALGLSVPDAETMRRFFGPSTREAVRKFQERHGLKVTGEVDASTASHLDTARSRLGAGATITPAAPSPVAGGAAPPLSEVGRPLRAAEPHPSGAGASDGVDTAPAREGLDTVERMARIEPASTGPAPLNGILDTIPVSLRLSEEEKLRFAGLHAEHGNGDPLWQAAERSELRAKLPAIKRTFALERLTGSHAPMMEALHTLSGASTAESTSYLTALSSREWRGLVAAHGAPEGVQPSVYAERLQAAVEREHPAAALLDRLRKNEAPIRNFPANEVKDFLAAHADFDFGAQSVDSYLKDKGIKSEGLRQSLKHISRALPLAGGRIDAAAAVIDAGLQNSYQITMAGPEKVKAQLSSALAEDVVNRIIKTANDKTMNALALGSFNFGRSSGATPRPPAGLTRAEGPTLQSLFGGMDFCECRHCRSVLGPAAYLADLLHFLETLPISNRAGKTALDGILARRPDLQHIELSCENTNTEIPYVDLALEVQENAVALPLPVVQLQASRPPRSGGLITISAPPTTFIPPGGGSSNMIGPPPDPTPASVAAQIKEGEGQAFDELPAKVREALQKTAITIGDTFGIKRTAHNAQTQDSVWAVSDGSRRWEIQRRVEHLRVWEDLPSGAQTRDLPELAAFDAIQTEFQRGYLHPNLVKALTPEALFPVKAVTGIEPAPLPTGALGGRATITREIAIEILPDSSSLFSVGSVKVFDHSGAQITESVLLSGMNFVPEWFREKTTNANADISMARIGITWMGLPVALIERASVSVNGNRYVVSLSQSFLFELVPDDMSVVALAYQDSSITANLAALPENRNPAAYARLGGAIFPWSLPCSLPLEETRAYLAELGIARRALIEMMTAADEENDALAAEILGLSEREWNLIAPAASDTPSPAAQWGVDPRTNWLYDERLGSYRTGAMQEVLRWVSVVMQQSRLSYRELLDVLQTAPANIRPGIAPENECEPCNLYFEGGSLENTLVWIHRFVRLWRRIGWTIRGIDRALDVFNRRIEDPATLRGLALMRLLSERLEAPTLVVAGMLGALETQTWTPNEPEGAVAEPSLYHRLFQQNALRASRSFPLFKLKSERELSAASADTLSGHAEFIAAALGVSTADALALSNVQNKVVAADELRFENVQLLYGAAAFARLLGLSTTDFLRWQCLLAPGAPPFTVTGAARAKALLAFRDDIVFARASGQDLDELEYLLLNKRVGDFANEQKEIEDGVRDIHSALLAGDVLAKTTNENLRTQLLRAGAPREFAGALESGASLAQYLRAEITFSWTDDDPPPAVPPELADRFDWSYDDDARQARFLCRGFVEAAAFDQTPLPAQARTQLRERYELIRDIVSSQVERLAPRDNSGAALPAPWFAFTFPDPAPEFHPKTPAVPPDFASFLGYDAAQGRLALTGYITREQGAALKAALDPRLAPGIDGLPEIPGRPRILGLIAQSNRVGFSWMENALALDLLRAPEDADIIARALRRTTPLLEGSLLAERVASLTGIEQRLCDALLDGVKVGGASRTARDAFFDDAFLASSGPISATANAAQLEALTRIKKAALLLNNVPLTAEQTAWMFGGAFSVLNVNALPVSVEAPPAPFAAWRAWRELLALAQSMKDGFAALQQLSQALSPGGTQPNALFREACEITEEPHVVNAVSELKMTWPEHFREPARVLKLVTLLNLMRMLGCKANLLKQFSVFSPSDADAMSARKLFMAQFDSDTLPKRMEPVSNRLRVRQRDALIDYLRWSAGLRGADDLLDYYLIDVEMGTCMRTSRIKQAISSVQLYVQRCLLGLERNNTLWPVAPDQISTKRWNWMKNYRVWEANRKIFLFPENWIEPELRDDKTEIFRALEAELLQEDLTHEKAIEAFSKYLEDAAGLAKLTVLNLEQEAVGDDYIVHFVAVDQGKPRNVYYRSLRLKQSPRTLLHWTPWEKVDGDIASDHAVIFKVGPFLHIGYPVLSSDDDSSSQKVGFAVRRKTRDGWTSAKQSADFLRMAIQPNKSPSSTIVLSKPPAGDATNPIARINLHAPSRLESLVSRSNEAPYQKSGTEQRYPTILTLHIRVLERFVDSLGNSFLQKTLRKLHLYFKLDRYEGVDIPDQPAKTIHFVAQGEFSFDDPVYKLTRRDDVEPDSDPHNELKDPTTDIWCLSITVVAEGDEAQHTTPRKTLSVSTDLEGQAEGVWVTDIIFQVKPEVSVEDLFPADRNLDPQLIPIGYFDISKDFAISVVDAKKLSIQDVSSPDKKLMECFGPGYLRIADVAEESSLLWKGQSEILSQTHGRYFIVYARDDYYGLDVLAYRDDRHALTLIPIYGFDHNQAYGVIYRVMSLGQDWTLDNGVAALAALPRNLDLQTLPVRENTVPPSLLLGADARAAGSTRELVPVFDPTFPASAYDWETFFHAPLLIAVQLSQAQRFEEARRWFHTIFDPTSNRPADPMLTAAQWEAMRYWRFPPFQVAALDELEVDDLLEAYARGALPPEKRDELEANIKAWKDNPFNPHLIARFRNSGYMSAVVIKYIQNLFVWGDQFFLRDTIESINEATQLYVLAARILGPRPQSAPKTEVRPRTYAELAELGLDEFTNVWNDWEYRQLKLTDLPTAGAAGGFRAAGSMPMAGAEASFTEASFTEPSFEVAEVAPLASLGSLYFCIPHNAGLTALWDMVEDRLFKIRNCMNIEGVERKLPLFEPPIDPALLVRAGAQGLDISAVLAGLGAPLPLHRFASTLPKAMEICADLRALGAAVLQALEKKDAEELALLRNSHEIALLKLTEQVRRRQIDEADMTLQGLEESRRTAEARYDYYQKLLGRADISAPKKDEIASLALTLTALAKSGPDGLPQGLGISQTESAQLALLRAGQLKSLESGAASTTGGVLLAIGGVLSALPRGTCPGLSLGDMGGPLTGAGHAMNATASFLNTLSGLATSQAGMEAIIAGYERRRDDWIFQSNMALREMAQIDKQWAAAEIRKEIAEKELSNTRAQIENAQKVDDFLTSKYSSAQLYRYMSNKLVELYFRTYQLAFEVARRAERCFQFELGQPNASFVKPGYWDSARKGLLSGEQLHFDLRRMDLAYLESHKREYEITKHVSLMQIDPLALIALRQTGACEFVIPEVFYDLDCPGHYMRRIKTVSVTVPCITGPYAGVHCTLTLLWSSVRKEGSGEDYKESVDDPRFIYDYSSVQSIVTSGAQADTGLFETNLRDERYLPFEGAGAISRWRLELPSEIRQFDYDTISDVILHVRYTARDGGARLKQSAASHARGFIAKVAPVRLFSVRHEFPNEWAKFKSGQDLVIEIKQEHYPFWTRGTGAKTARGPSLIQGAPSVRLLASSSSGAQASQILVTTIDTKNITWEAKLVRQKSMADLLMGTFKPPAATPASELGELKSIGDWNLHLDNSAIDDLWIAVDWSARANP